MTPAGKVPRSPTCACRCATPASSRRRIAVRWWPTVSNCGIVPCRPRRSTFRIIPTWSGTTTRNARKSCGRRPARKPSPSTTTCGRHRARKNSSASPAGSRGRGRRTWFTVITRLTSAPQRLRDLTRPPGANDTVPTLAEPTARSGHLPDTCVAETGRCPSGYGTSVKSWVALARAMSFATGGLVA